LKGNQDAWVGNQEGVEQAETRKKIKRRIKVEERNIIKPIFPLRTNPIIIHQRDEKIKYQICIFRIENFEGNLEGLMIKI
jgi:hypothetical protein